MGSRNQLQSNQGLSAQNLLQILHRKAILLPLRHRHIQPLGHSQHDSPSPKQSSRFSRSSISSGEDYCCTGVSSVTTSWRSSPVSTSIATWAFTQPLLLFRVSPPGHSPLLVTLNPVERTASPEAVLEQVSPPEKTCGVQGNDETSISLRLRLFQF